ncbi:MAG: hypothetical protein ACFE9D_08520 [Promethearchaeota archaeon]
MPPEQQLQWEPLLKLLNWLRHPDWLFLAFFIPIVVLKLGIFHFAASQYLISGYHPYFNMDFEVVEAYSDFTYYYMNFVRAFVQGNLPYTEALYTVEGTQVYIYPPLFVYILSAFYFFPAEVLFPDIQFTAAVLARDLDFLRVAFAFIIFDLATCVVIYATAKRLTENRVIPLVALLVFALNPVSLWWGNYLWLSTPIHTFFLVLGFYFMIRGNLRWALVIVTVATMVKQTAGLLIPVIWFLEYRRGLQQLLIAIGITAAVGIVLSLPYLVLYPATYIEALTAGLGGYWFYDELPAVTHPIPVSTLAFFWPEPFKAVIFNLVYYEIPFIIALMSLWIISYMISEQPLSTYREQLLLVALLLSLSAHIFLARGIFKFYLIALLPFLILFGAILKGPLIPVQELHCPVQSRAAKYMASLPPWLLDIIHRFQNLSLGNVNNVTTWWFVLVGLASVSIFAIHRYFTHVILLALFLLLLVYGVSKYGWKWLKQRKRKKHDRESKIKAG